jgi:hypothetical protein
VGFEPTPFRTRPLNLAPRHLNSDGYVYFTLILFHITLRQSPAARTRNVVRPFRGGSRQRSGPAHARPPAATTAPAMPPCAFNRWYGTRRELGHGDHIFF